MENQDKDKKPEFRKVSSLRDLVSFQKLGNSNFLIHKSTLDFWKMSDDGAYIVKVVNDDLGPIKD